MTQEQAGKLSINRRRVLQMIAAAGPAAAALDSYPLMAGGVSKKQKGYGPDPDMNNPRVTWNKALTKTQLKTLTILGDIIIPADDKSPAASAFDIADFVNEWVSAPYPTQQGDRKTILAGLKWLDWQAGNKYGQRRYRKLPANQQLALFDDLATSVQDGSAGKEQEKFFKRLVYLFVGGFYTTEEGMADIGYIGNVPLESFDGPTLEVRKQLGL